MTTPLARRLGRIERTIDEATCRPIREQILRICRRLGAELSPDEVETLVARHVGTSARIARMRRDGWSDDRIRDCLLGEVAGQGAG